MLERLANIGYTALDMGLDYCVGEDRLLEGDGWRERVMALRRKADALKAGRRPRASYQQTLHVLEVLTGFERAVRNGGYLELTTTYEREAPMAQGLPHGVLE